jgi:K+-transporting ATPase ATPase A chain
VNCNLQTLFGESGLTYLTQLFVITFLQFLSAATGIAVWLPYLMGKRKDNNNLGNFWNYLVKSTTRILLP